MDIEYQSTKSNLEKEKEETLVEMTKIMSSFYDGVKEGFISHEIAEEKQKAIDLFIASLYLKKLEPIEFKLYYVLLGQEIKQGVSELDTESESIIDIHGAGSIQNFIERNFRKINK